MLHHARSANHHITRNDAAASARQRAASPRSTDPDERSVRRGQGQLSMIIGTPSVAAFARLALPGYIWLQFRREPMRVE